MSLKFRSKAARLNYSSQLFSNWRFEREAQGAPDNFSRRGLSLLRKGGANRQSPRTRHDFSSESSKIVGDCGAGNCRVNGSQASRGHFLLHFIASRLKWRREKGVEISLEIIKTLERPMQRCNRAISARKNDFRSKARAIVPVTIVHTG